MSKQSLFPLVPELSLRHFKAVTSLTLEPQETHGLAHLKRLPPCFLGHTPPHTHTHTHTHTHISTHPNTHAPTVHSRTHTHTPLYLPHTHTHTRTPLPTALL